MGEKVKSVKTAFQKACKKAGLEGVSVHSLRHTFASHLIMAGVPIKTGQVLLGHKSIGTTLDIYGHLSPEHIALAVNRLPYQNAGAKVIPFMPKKMSLSR